MKRSNPIVIGITGGVGSGKSQVLSYLVQKEFCIIFELDKVAHLLQEPGTECYRRIVGLFGPGILREDGGVDRIKLGAKVFADKLLLQALNNIIHPEVKQYIRNQIKLVEKGSLVIIEGALLIEAGYQDICDEFWFIRVSPEVRMERVMKSRGYTSEKFKQIMNQQLSDEVFENECHVVIDNSSDMKCLQDKIEDQLLILLGENK